MKRTVFALLLLGCDAAEEGRGPGIYPAGLTTTSTTTTGGTTVETTSSGAQDSATTDDTTTTTTSAASTSSTTAEITTTGETTTSTTTGEDATTGGDPTTSTSTTTAEATTGGEPPCPCLPEIQAGQNLCNAQPTPECPATLPGGLCDPNGDGSYADADWMAGYQGYLESCG